MTSKVFFPYSWHLDDTEEEITSIRVYGLGEDNKNICIRVDNFTPYVYLELPTNIVWNSAKAQLVGNKIDELTGNSKPLSKVFLMKKRLYRAYFDEKGNRKKFPYLFVSFSNKNDIKVLSYRLRSALHVVGLGAIKLKMHESDADPILQLVCCRSIPTAGWVKFIGDRVPDEEKVTLCEQEYMVKWKTLFPVDRNDVPKPKVMGFDIEVNSTNPSAMPKAEKPGDKVFQISCVIYRVGDSQEKYQKYLLTLGDPEPEIVGKDVIIFKFNTEASLIVEFTEMIRRHNINLITGYNILGFDIPYMIARAKLHMCIFNFDRQGFHKTAHSKEKIIKWSSSAYKNQEFEFLDAEGRVFIDLLPLIRRDFKFNSYSLKTVSEYFVGETKDPLGPKGIFKCFRIGIQRNQDGTYGKTARKAMAIVGKYCLAENTQVSTKHGTIPIQDMCGTNTDVLSWNEKTNNIEISIQSNFFNNGIRECIELCLEDGRTIICTPDHQLATINGWVNASDISIGETLKIGPILPEVDIDTNDTIYSRILGYLITDGHISKERCVAYIGNILDAQIFSEDIEKLCGILPSIGKGNKDNCWYIHIPLNLRYLIINKESWIGHGNRTKSNETLPDITTWSKSMVREFLGGLFGGDGWCPCLDKSSNKFTTIGFTQSRYKYEIIVKYMEILCKMLNIFDINSKYRITNRNGLFIGSLSIQMLDIDKFVTKIGYRYCYSKTIRASIVTIYQRIKNNTRKDYELLYEQIMNSTNMSSVEAYKLYRTNYKYYPPYSTIKSWKKLGRIPSDRPSQLCRNFPSARNFLEEYGLTNLFILPGYHTYAMGKDDDILPTFGLRLKSIKYIGLRQVYDITVENTHSFLANGIVAHNCVQDSALVCLIMEKLKTWVGLTEMAKTCRVSMFALYTQGQQIKVYSQLYDYCMKNDIVVEKDAYQVQENERYVGAKVFPPIPGRYKMVVPFDFASLYPTTIIAYNIDYHTWVPDDSNIPDSKCHVMEWHDHVGCEHDPKVIRKKQLTDYITVEQEKIKKLREKRNKTSGALGKKELMNEINHLVEQLKPYTNERAEISKTIAKIPMCEHRRYRFLKEPKGVVPTVIQNLLAARKHTRKVDMKKCKDEIKRLQCQECETGVDNSELIKEQEALIDVLDKRQLSYKVSCNSMYGIMGVRKGYLPFMPGAMCTTFMGRENIEVVATTIPEKYGGELVYGDTDTLIASTPVLILKNGKICYTTLENLSSGNWEKTITGKELSTPIEGVKVWSDQGFTEIKYVMRHAIEKQLIKVTTHTGNVICTLDHSLLWENGQPALGSEIKVTDKLCHRKLPLPDDTPKEPVYPNNLTAEKIRSYIISDEVYQGLSANLAFVWGTFFADGSCGSYQLKSGMKHSWAISKKDNILLERCANILRICEPNLDFKILDTVNSTHANKLVPYINYEIEKESRGTIKAYVEKYRSLFYDDRKYKKVPDVVLNAPYSIREAFFMGYYAGDGSKKDPALILTNKGEIGCAGLFFLLRSIGYQVSINTRSDKPDTYKLTGSTPMQKFRYHPNAVKKIEPYQTEDMYIYDIETENHHFAAGIGEMVVHNSNYIHFPHLETAQETWDHALYVASEITKLFPPPIELEFEQEIYSFFFILSKKRYMYRKCLRDGIVDKKIGKKGVLLARRDNSKFVRDIYESVISKIADDESRDDIIYYIMQEINSLCSGTKPYTDFVITKAVGNCGELQPEAFINEKGVKKAKLGGYTVPILSTNKEERNDQIIKKGAENIKEYYLMCLPAQVQLAERMKARGQRVDAGTRLEYIVTNPKEHTAKQYEKIEHADYLAKHSDIIKIDYLYYLKQLVNPMDQLLDVAFGKDKDYKLGMVMDQYKYRWKVHTKMLEELKSMTKPIILIK